MEYWYQLQLSAKVKIREELHFEILKAKVWHNYRFLRPDAFLCIKLFIH